MKPVAYAMFRDGQFYDAIHPDEYIKTAGEYDTPLYTYTHPKELTDDEIVNIGTEFLAPKNCDIYTFARAILRKAQDE